MMPNARNTYLDASVATGSPARLLVMLYERLVLDLQRGLAALEAGDLPGVHRELLHAQEIVLELHASLRTEDWAGGPGLASLYDYLHTQLVRANVNKDPALTAGCLDLATALCTAWREAAAAAALAG